MRLHLAAWFAIILAASAWTGSASAQTFERTIKANTAAPVGGFFGYEVDTCYKSAIPSIKVRTQPANGTFQIRPYQVTLDDKTRCPGLKVDGQIFIYTPKKGFKGTDEVEVDIPWDTTDIGPGTVYTRTYKIKVE